MWWLRWLKVTPKGLAQLVIIFLQILKILINHHNKFKTGFKTSFKASFKTGFKASFRTRSKTVSKTVSKPVLSYFQNQFLKLVSKPGFNL